MITKNPYNNNQTPTPTPNNDKPSTNSVPTKKYPIELFEWGKLTQQVKQKVINTNNKKRNKKNTITITEVFGEGRIKNRILFTKFQRICK